MSSNIGRVRRTLRRDPAVISAEGLTENSNREVDRLMELVARRLPSSGVYADRPTVTERDAGAMYVTPEGETFIHDGELWRPIVGGILCTQPPEAAIWQAGQGIHGSTGGFADAGGKILISGATNAGTAYREGYAIDLSTPASSVVVEAGFTGVYATASGGTLDLGFGILLYEKSSGKTFGAEYFFTQSATASSPAKVRKGYSGTLSGPAWTTSEVYVANIPSTASVFLRISIKGGNLRPWVSADRFSWQAIGNTVPVTTAFTTAPTKVGIYSISGDYNLTVCSHFQQGYAIDFPSPNI